MTNEQIEKNAKERFKNKPVGYEMKLELDIYIEGFLDGAKENGIIWHDLRKDPNDLPKKHNKLSDRSDLVITDKGIATYHFIYRKWYVHSSECDLSFPETVIAWCEIPKYVEE